MTKRITRDQITDKAILHRSPLVATTVNRTFELPTGLYVTTVAAYLSFLAILFAGFASGPLAILMVIFAVSIVMGFGVPAVWLRLKPNATDRAIDWGRFGSNGIQTFTGLVSRRDAAAQVLVLPLLIVAWGIGTVMIAGIVR